MLVTTSTLAWRACQLIAIQFMFCIAQKYVLRRMGMVCTHIFTYATMFILHSHYKYGKYILIGSSSRYIHTVGSDPEYRDLYVTEIERDSVILVMRTRNVPFSRSDNGSYCSLPRNLVLFICYITRFSQNLTFNKQNSDRYHVNSSS